MHITIMTDASLCGKHRVGGFGYWIASPRGKKAGGGILKGTVKDSYEAEFKAVANSLYIAIQHKLVHSGDNVLIQLDNSGVIHSMSGSNNIRKDIQEVVDIIVSLRTEYQLNLEFRHVKGHSKKTENRYIANKMCDLRAKHFMRKARENAINDI